MLSQMAQFATLANLRSNELLPQHSTESACFCKSPVTAEKKYLTDLLFIFHYDISVIRVIL
jgi:hypothetical protein